MNKIKKLSCQRCRLKKIKCNYENPCVNCIKGKYECVQVVNDMRKKRPTISYVESLERKYYQILQVIKSFNEFETVDEKSAFLKSVNLDYFLTGDALEDYTRNEIDDNDESVYGPISIYDNSNKNHRSLTVQNDEFKYIKQVNTNPQILQCIKLFFVWQYPDLNMFIFREAFLQEFFKPKHFNLYCSKSLILSICALGARMSDNDSIYLNSINYYNEAKNLLLNHLNYPTITSLQSFLLLSFYDIFNGSNSSGWMLSGNAIRMGFDLGFQLHPNSWFLKQKVSNYSKEIDNEIKSRIYWGTYLADHFISLLLGRPSLLKLNDATIPETDDLPELHWIDEFRYLDDNEKTNQLKKVSNISSPLKNVINLINISDNMLNDIFNKNFNQDFTKDSKSLVATLNKLNEYNEKILHWKTSLPDDLKFNKAFLVQNGDNPTLGCIRYYYYIMVLCLNRPFLGLNDDRFDPQLNPKLICVEAIDDLFVAIQKFRSVHGLQKASIFIVYCSILSLSTILLLKSSTLIKNEVTKLKFFLSVLKACSRTWKLAEKSFNSITSSLASFEDVDMNLSDLDDPNFNDLVIRSDPSRPESPIESKDIDDTKSANTSNPSNANIFNSIEFFGGPPVLMTSDLFDQDWESLFPDYIFNDKT